MVVADHNDWKKVPHFRSGYREGSTAKHCPVMWNDEVRSGSRSPLLSTGVTGDRCHSILDILWTLGSECCVHKQCNLEADLTINGESV